MAFIKFLRIALWAELRAVINLMILLLKAEKVKHKVIVAERTKIIISRNLQFYRPWRLLSWYMSLRSRWNFIGLTAFPIIRRAFFYLSKYVRRIFGLRDSHHVWQPYKSASNSRTMVSLSDIYSQTYHCLFILLYQHGRSDI